MNPTARLVSLVAAAAVLATACATSVRLEVEASQPQPEVLEPSPTAEVTAVSVDSVRAAAAALAGYSSFEVTLDMDTGTSGDDLDLMNVVQVDRVSGIFEWRLNFTGEDWPDRLGSDPASGRAIVDTTFRYMGDGVGPLYFTFDPIPDELDPAKPWIQLTPAQFGLAGGVNAVALDPRAAVSDFPFLEGDLESIEDLGRDAVGGEDMDHYAVSATHAVLLNYLPASLGQALVDDGLSGSFEGSSTVEIWIDDQSALRRLTIEYPAFIAEAIELGSTRDFAGLELSLDYRFGSFDEPLGLELPSDDLVDFDADLGDGGGLPSLAASGECYSEEELFFTDGAPVSCTEAHIAEVYAVTDLEEPSGADWPGLEAVQDRASTFCNDSFRDIMGVPGEISALDVLFFRPDQQTWNDGDREVACFVQYPESVSEPMTSLDPMREFGLVSSYQLETGDCVADTSLVDAVALTAVECSAEHWHEVYASQTIGDGTYPGEDAVVADADAFCEAEFETFVGVSYSDSALLIENLWPTAESWELWGDRLISCSVTSSDGPRSASAAGTRN